MNNAQCASPEATEGIMKVERILTPPLITPAPGGSIAGKLKSDEHGVTTEDAVTLDQRKEQKRDQGTHHHHKYTKDGQQELPVDVEQAESGGSINLTA